MSIVCAKSIFNRHNLKPDKYFVVTNFGIEKNHNFNNLASKTKITLKKIRILLINIRLKKYNNKTEVCFR